MRKLTEYDYIIRPVITEKSQGFQELGKYVFEVHQNSNKMQIKKAIESLFNVKVSSVNMLKKPSKNKVFKGQKGRRPGFKKAIVSTVDKKRIELGGV